jgi:hypothetical protein
VFVRFQCKIVKRNFAIFGHNRIFAQTGVKVTNKDLREKELVVLLALPQSWGIPFVPAILLVIEIGTDFDPRPGVGGTG